MIPTKFRFIWPSGFRGEDFQKQTNQNFRNKNWLWRPCLLTNGVEICNPYRGPSIHASYQVSVHLVKGIQRRRLKFEKFTYGQRQQTSSDGNSSRCLWEGELKSSGGKVLKICIIKNHNKTSILGHQILFTNLFFFYFNHFDNVTFIFPDESCEKDCYNKYPFGEKKIKQTNQVAKPFGEKNATQTNQTV